MSQGALVSWKKECETVHSEMDRLLTAGWPETSEERQVRKIQFMALIQRRNDAAHDFLKSYGSTATQQEPSEITALPSAPNSTTEVEIINGQISQEPSAADHATDRCAQLARDPQAPPADPMFEARNFLKFLGLK